MSLRMQMLIIGYNDGTAGSVDTVYTGYRSKSIALYYYYYYYYYYYLMFDSDNKVHIYTLQCTIINKQKYTVTNDITEQYSDAIKPFFYSTHKM